MADIIKVKVKANSSESKIVYDPIISGYKVFVKAQAEKGKANIELINLLTKFFKRKVEIVSGFTSDDKVIKLI
ncbi:DUF167 domain-containing protein [Candidatus Woesearchaeota archaeon]|nr:DUF167 domain-containing protein [Candidatus Woesearchaeota archaeon]